MTRKVNHSITVGLAAIALCSVSANLMAAVNNPKISREVILPQNESLFGYVYDQDKNPLPGVTVKVEGTQIVTITDDEGRYSFSQPIRRGANVKFSMLGFKTKRVVYKGQSAISPMLEPSATSVGEVVVVARSNINAIDLRAKSGVVENVDMKRVEAKPMIDMALALQGAVPCRYQYGRFGFCSEDPSARKLFAQTGQCNQRAAVCDGWSDYLCRDIL